jgi:hypothetical protein
VSSFGVNVLIDASDVWCRWMVVRLSRVPLNFGGGPHDRQAAILADVRSS